VPDNLTRLRVFVAVADCGNLTRAAERQHLAVSAISKRITELEGRARTPLAFGIRAACTGFRAGPTRERQ
jgi:hypothetical protein